MHQLRSDEPSTLRGTLLILVTSVLLGACASAPLEAGSIDDARERYAAVSDTPRIFDFAASSIRQAQQHLMQAEQLYDDDASQEEVDHQSFLARQHLAIAEARLRRALAQQDVEQAEDRRRSLLLEAERREAVAAAERAEAMESELTDTRMQLRMAEQRAKALADRLVEAGLTSSRESD